ncbi:MAG: hypothetical protein OEW75_08260 [Cyclobacteriaceae bacterium]|nr:hypothetical protein [Cyclobacteriaceae bacterium]
MKTKYIFYLILFSTLFGCQKNTIAIHGTFEFIKEYTTTITVGGIVGITEKTFNVGEVYQGTDQGKDYITIRIADHSYFNDDCPNSWCYQELLDVPREYLMFVE